MNNTGTVTGQGLVGKLVESSEGLTEGLTGTVVFYELKYGDYLVDFGKDFGGHRGIGHEGLEAKTGTHYYCCEKDLTVVEEGS
jgi:hypothetical protein